MLKSFKRTLVMTIAVMSLLCILGLGANAASGSYTVLSGDTLWKIAGANGLTVTQLKQYNSLTSDTIYVGQKLTLSPAAKYTVKSGDTLWAISRKYMVTVDAIKNFNHTTSDTIYVGQVLFVPLSLNGQPSGSSPAPTPTPTPAPATTRPSPVTAWPSVTYIVKDGDYVSVVAAKFGVSQAQILKYNYMDTGEWLNAGEKIAINGYAPRNWDVVPGESTAPLRKGKYVDWFFDGQYLIKRNDVFLITDVSTGLQFQVKMLGGYNHSDIEPLTANDTLVMKKLFPVWNWTPRPVVIFHRGINFAASLSGMPHSFDSLSGNNVSEHFDLYLKNSTAHGTSVSAAYEQQHQNNVLIAAGLK